MGVGIMELEEIKAKTKERPEDKSKRIRPKLCKKMDNLHWNSSKIDGTQKKNRVVGSGRGGGKTTFWVSRYRDNYETGRTYALLKRKIKKVTATTLKDIERKINEWVLIKIKFIFNASELHNGICDVYVAEIIDGEECNKRFFFRIMALNLDSDELKGQEVPNIRGMIFDEFIIRPGNPNDKYLNNEALIVKELAQTLSRCVPDGESLIIWYLANFYSLFNPHFEKWGVDTRKLHPGVFLVGSDWAIEWFKLPPELIAQIKAKNNEEEDPEYDRFAYGGEAIEDQNIPLGEKPQNAKLKYVIKTNGEYLGFYSNPFDVIKFYCEKLEWKAEYARTSYCFDFQEAQVNTSIFQKQNKALTYQLRKAISDNRVIYKDISAYYLTEYIYPKI